MTKKTGLVLAGLMLMSVVACGGPAPEVDDAGDEEAPARETVFDDTIRTQDRGKAVEGVTMEHKRDVDEAIAESEGGGSEAGE
jgi:hypothetical protein